jgi:Family of unknown function (DUF6884)
VLGKRLLILSCSRTKRTDQDLLPAIERYDGPGFRVVRRFLREREGVDSALDTYILSAEFGLITADQLIPAYDRRMTSERALALRPVVRGALQRACAASKYHDALVAAGRDYLPALAGWEGLLPSEGSVGVTEGPPGSRLRQLYDWLRRP